MTTSAGTDGSGAERHVPEGNGTANGRWPGHRAAHPGGEIPYDIPYDHRDRRDGSRRGGTSHGEGKRDA